MTEHSTESRRLGHPMIGAILALLFGTFAAYVDAHNNEVQAAVLVILVGGFCIGVSGSSRVWVSAIALGCCIFISNVVTRAGGITTGPFIRFDMLIAIAPALIGTLAGLFARMLVKQGVDTF